MVDYFRKLFLWRPSCIYINSTGFITWWEIENHELVLNRSIKNRIVYFIVVPATYQRIDKSKELIDMLKDNKW